MIKRMTKRLLIISCAKLDGFNQSLYRAAYDQMSDADSSIIRDFHLVLSVMVGVFNECRQLIPVILVRRTFDITVKARYNHSTVYSLL